MHAASEVHPGGPGFYLQSPEATHAEILHAEARGPDVPDLMTTTFRPALAPLAAALLACAACAGRTSPPEPGTSRGSPPDLRGASVMVLPVQAVHEVGGDADAELSFGLTDRRAGVTWIFPARLEEALSRAPALDTRVRGLSVGTFSQAEVRRVGDPLYGELRRLAELVDAEVALLPLSAVAVTVPDGGTSVRFTVATVHVRTGRVLWFGVVEGEPHPAGDPRGLASAVDTLARTLLWFAPGGGVTG